MVCSCLRALPDTEEGLVSSTGHKEPFPTTRAGGRGTEPRGTTLSRGGSERSLGSVRFERSSLHCLDAVTFIRSNSNWRHGPGKLSRAVKHCQR